MRIPGAPTRNLRFWPLLGQCLLLLLSLLLVLSIILVGSLRWLDPTTSSFMLQHKYSDRGSGRTIPLRHQWVKLDQIAPEAVFAVIAAEDQRFRNHHGFDFRAIRLAIIEYRNTGVLRGSSTISQQTAKNLYLWPRSSPGRKIIEIWFTLHLELLLQKPRILEIYLNIAQFGPNIYGIEAASQRYFGKPAGELTAEEGAILAAVLPGPVRLRADAPSQQVLDRQAWILRQMKELLKRGYLDGLHPDVPDGKALTPSGKV